MFRTISKFALLALFASAAQAAEYRYNGTKAQAVIDVRTPAEFAAGHVDGAINIPVEVIGEQIASWAEDYATCENGGAHAYACPFGCHVVPVWSAAEKAEELERELAGE